MINCTFSNNNSAAGTGGAICNPNANEETGVAASTLTVINSTFSGNDADFGGAIFVNGTASVSFSTFSGNSGPRGGGAIFSEGTLTLKSNLLAGQPSGGNCYIFNGTANFRRLQPLG